MDFASVIFNPLFFPFTNLVLLLPVDWETLNESFWKILLLFLSIAFYTATSLWAGFIAYKHQFSRYRLDVVRSVDSAVLGSFFGWLYCFPYVIINRRKIMQGEARLLSELAPHERQSKGAVLDVLIWVIVWAVIMAAVIPGLTPSRLRTCEQQAVVTLRAYARAQEQYRRVGNSGYCPDSRELFFGPGGSGSQYLHISRHRINAFARNPETRAGITPSHGYVFYDDPFVTENGLWREQFGYFAFPGMPGKTGMHIYWIGKSRVVFMQEFVREMKVEDAVSFDNSPLHPQGKVKWEPFEK